MGGLAHFFENEGVPTTQISLIRLHTEKIRPPRALWVPFELGRPFGPPNDPVFQRRVLRAALTLLEAPKGPVLEDFEEDAPDAGHMSVGLACPVDFGGEKGHSLDGVTDRAAALQREMNALRPWYDRALKQRGRTTVGVSGVDLDAMAGFICAFLDGERPPSPREDLSLPYVLNLATDDLKAYYFEAITAQPGQEGVLSSQAVSDWFWGETVAGRILLHIKARCSRSEDKGMRLVGQKFIVPMDR